MPLKQTLETPATLQMDTSLRFYLEVQKEINGLKARIEQLDGELAMKERIIMMQAHTINRLRKEFLPHES